jgi:hypothetical protein
MDNPSLILLTVDQRRITQFELINYEKKPDKITVPILLPREFKGGCAGRNGGSSCGWLSSVGVR